MKEIKAYIKKNMLNQVIEELHKIDGLTGVSVSEIMGFGRERSKKDAVRIVDNLENFVPHVKLEIFCADDLVEKVITAIQVKAHTGLREDGKIYISEVLDAVRISTNERGETAV